MDKLSKNGQSKKKSPNPISEAVSPTLSVMLFDITSSWKKQFMDKIYLQSTENETRSMQQQNTWDKLRKHTGKHAIKR